MASSQEMIKAGRIKEPVSLFEIALSSCLRRETRGGAFYYVIEGNTLYVPYAQGVRDILEDVLLFAKRISVKHIQFVTYRKPLLKVAGGICKQGNVKMDVIGYVVKVSL